MLHCQDIAPFASPRIELEQYPTGPHLASRLLFTVRVSANSVPAVRLDLPRRLSAERIYDMLRIQLKQVAK